MITMKSIKYFASGSQETPCYNADVFWEGYEGKKPKKVAHVSNGGYGAGDDVDILDADGYAQMQEYIEGCDPRTWEDGQGKTYLSPESLCNICAHELDRFLSKKEFQKVCRKWSFFIGEMSDWNGSYRILDKRYARKSLDQLVEGYRSEGNNVIILNDLTLTQWNMMTGVEL